MSADQPDVITEDDVRDDLAQGLSILNDRLDDAHIDMGQITWYALAIAERAQHWARNTVTVEDDTEDRKFVSMDGLLADARGALVHAGTEHLKFPNIAAAFGLDERETDR